MNDEISKLLHPRSRSLMIERWDWLEHIAPTLILITIFQCCCLLFVNKAHVLDSFEQPRLAIKTPHSCISSLNELGLRSGNWLRRSWRDARRRRSWRRWTVMLCGRRRSWEHWNRRSRTSRRRCSRTNALWNLRWEALTTTLNLTLYSHLVGWHFFNY